MSTETKNLHLTKPHPDDFYDINIMNENWEKVDEEIEKKATKTHQHDERYSLKSDVGSKQSLATDDKSNIVNAINEVKDVTATVKVTADQANAKATQGKSMAESAQVAADAARDKAETAQSAAEVAGQKADAAQSAAETAAGKADSAQAKANQASSKAEEAKTKADQAFQLGVEVKKDVVEALNSKKTISDSTTSSAWSSLINKIKGIKEGRGNAQKSNVLSGKTFTNNDGVEYAGTMPNRGTVNANLVNHNQEYTIPAGYHSGAGKIKATISGLVAGAIKYGTKVGNITGTFTGDANASASHILSGKTAYVKGNKVTGTMANRTGGYNTDNLSRSGNELRMSVPDAGYYSDGAYVKYTDNDWVENNIKAGVNMFGKVGTYCPLSIEAIDDYIEFDIFDKGNILNFPSVGVVHENETRIIEFQCKATVLNIMVCLRASRTKIKNIYQATWVYNLEDITTGKSYNDWNGQTIFTSGNIYDDAQINNVSFYKDHIYKITVSGIPSEGSRGRISSITCTGIRGLKFYVDTSMFRIQD